MTAQFTEPVGLRRRGTSFQPEEHEKHGGGYTPSNGTEDQGKPEPRDVGDSKGPKILSELPSKDRHRSKLAQLWLASRLQSPSSKSLGTRATSPEQRVDPYRPKGEDRPLTKENIKLAIILGGELWRPFLQLFWEDHKLRILGFFARRVIKGVIPACKAWSQAEMLDVVQRSFQPGAVSREEVLRTAILSLLLTASDDIYRFFSSHQDNMVRILINHTMERSYLSVQLSQSIPSMSSPYDSALLYEAGVFAGFESRSMGNGNRMTTGGPFGTLQCLFSLVTISVEVITQVLLLLRTLSSGGGSHMTISNVILILLSLAPTIFRLIGAWLFRAKGSPRGAHSFWRKSRQEESSLKEMGRKGDYKQEVVLFGLRDWILERWDRVRQEQLKEQEEQKERHSVVEIGLGIGQHGVQTVFYVLLALRTLSTDLSLGSIKLYQSIATSLLSSIRLFTETLESCLQAVFYLAAFIEATSDPEGLDSSLRLRASDDTPLIDYETTRQSGGMSIEAKDLSFTYPGSTQPVLKGINLSIRAGETLAIVGFNGGGKTTLVKALMGLYDHSGQLLINGNPVEDYVPQTLHRRTSCLFQDFCRYSLTLRENVGVGDVAKMKDDAMIEMAMERGGAEKIREKVGLEGKLNKTGVPDASNGDEITIGNANTKSNDENEERPIPPMMAPGSDGGGGRGRGRGRGGRPGGGPGRGGDGPPPPGMPPPPPPPPSSDGPTQSMPGLFTLAFGHPRRHWMNGPEKEERAALSGGQWQRVALSRAFLRSEEADLVVFDEPSASLDPRAEATLFQRIHALSNQNGRRTTTIYISHRFSTVRKADQIAVVEEGTIVEVGSHAELMAREGRYAELFNLQKEGFE